MKAIDILTADCDSTRGPSGCFVACSFQDAAGISVWCFLNNLVLHVLASKDLYSASSL